MKVYLSGPMKGYPEWNYPAFHRAAAQWRARGREVLNPAENFGGDTAKTFAEYMRVDIADVLTADAVVVLDGWESSRGALLEIDIALVLGLSIIENKTGKVLTGLRVERAVHHDA